MGNNGTRNNHMSVINSKSSASFNVKGLAIVEGVRVKGKYKRADEGLEGLP